MTDEKRGITYYLKFYLWTWWTFWPRVLIVVVISAIILYLAVSALSFTVNYLTGWRDDAAIAAKKKELEDLNKKVIDVTAQIASLTAEEAAKRAAMAEVEKQRLAAIDEKDKAVKARDEFIAATNIMIENLRKFQGKKGVTAQDVECVVLGRCK